VPPVSDRVFVNWLDEDDIDRPNVAEQGGLRLVMVRMCESRAPLDTQLS
jgi:hypothetical protein